MKMFLNGQPANASDGATIEVTNPATGALIETIPSATEDDIKAAVAYAKAAQPTWAKVPVHEKADILMKFLDLVARDHERRDGQAHRRGTGGDLEHPHRVPRLCRAREAPLR